MSEREGWDGAPPDGTPWGSWHILLDTDGDEYRALWDEGAWRFDPPWDGDWGLKEVDTYELAVLCFRYGRPEA